MVARGHGGVEVNLALLPYALMHHKENMTCVKQARLNHFSHEHTSQEEKD